MTRKQWARRMTLFAILLLVCGLALMVAGSLMAGSNPKAPMPGIGVGMAGVFLLTAGGLFGKFAIAGPYPKTLEE